MAAVQAEKKTPTEEVRSMVSHGFSERDIIKQLKAQGYSFGEIEKAIMEVVKSGVSAQPEPAPVPEQAPEPATEKEEPRRESRKAYSPPDVLEPLPPLPAEPEPEPPEAAEEEQQYVEDIVESVLEEKFEKFMAELKTVKSEMEQLRSEVRMIKERKNQAPDISADIAKRIDDMEARVGGLEKAFRQYLPELARGIERLSKMVKKEA